MVGSQPAWPPVEPGHKWFINKTHESLQSLTVDRNTGTETQWQLAFIACPVEGLEAFRHGDPHGLLDSYSSLPHIWPLSQVCSSICSLASPSLGLHSSITCPLPVVSIVCSYPWNQRSWSWDRRAARRDSIVTVVKVNWQLPVPFSVSRTVLMFFLYYV